MATLPRPHTLACTLQFLFEVRAPVTDFSLSGRKGCHKQNRLQAAPITNTERRNAYQDLEIKNVPLPSTPGHSPLSAGLLGHAAPGDGTREGQRYLAKLLHADAAAVHGGRDSIRSGMGRAGAKVGRLVLTFLAPLSRCLWRSSHIGLVVAIAGWLTSVLSCTRAVYSRCPPDKLPRGSPPVKHGRVCCVFRAPTTYGRRLNTSVWYSSWIIL